MKTPRWLKRTGIWILGILVVLVSLYALGCAWFSWFTKYEWLRTKKELEAKGEKLSLVELLPSPIPDEENFFASPLFQNVITLSEGTPLERKTLVLIEKMDIRSPDASSSPAPANVQRRNSKGLANLEYWVSQNGLRSAENRDRSSAEIIQAEFDKKQDLWKALDEAAEKSGAYFPYKWEQGKAGDSGTLACGSAVMKLAQLLNIRSLANMELHRPKDALHDNLLIFRLADSLSSSPLLLTQLIRLGCVSIAVQNVWEGLERHVWTGEELKKLEARLASQNLLTDLAFSLRGERGFFIQGISLMLAGDGPWKRAMTGFQAFPTESFLRMNMTSSARLFQEVIDKLETEKEGINANRILFPEVPTDLQQLPIRKQMHLLFYMTVAPLKNVVIGTAERQAQVDMARIACALERYKMAKGGAYPENLEALVPGFIAQLPNDIASSKPYHYRRNAPNQFTLWSVGFDGADDNKTPVADKQSQTGDWVWGNFGRS